MENEYHNEQQNLTKKERKEIRREEKRESIEQGARTRKMKKAIIWTSTIVGVILIVWGLAKLGSHSPGASVLIDQVSEADHVRGNQDSGVVFVEYGDFQCPACGAYHPIVQQLTEEFGDRVGFVFRHFPLNRIHQNADLAARASEASGKQGKFWEMHDMLFESQSEWSQQRSSEAEETFTRYAQSLGLDLAKFDNDLDIGEVKDKVDGDFNSGTRSGVSGTPTFFLNGERIKNPQSYEEFQSFFNDAIESSNNPASVPQGS
jgi:protein-disulfide isomerase